MRYLPLTPNERDEILKTCKVSRFEDLIEQIPKDLQLGRPLKTEGPYCEEDLVEHVHGLAQKNKASSCTSFLGQGVYDHTWPRVIDQIINRGEFLTAYTPYQPEISQGTLQMIFEYQSMLASMVGMEVSNASLYDGATSVVEAALMATRLQGKKSGTLVITEGTYDRYQEILKNYLEPLGFKFVIWKADGKSFSSRLSTLNATSLKSSHTDIVGIIAQSPNRWGIVEDWNEVSKSAKELNTLSVGAVTHALSLGLFQSPGEAGIDIVAGEAQSLGIPVGFGGPHLGLICCRKKDVRQIPGRLVGVTVDSQGRRAFCVTLATREQHIRREKATSNICSNQNLIALRAALFMSLMGPEGIKQLATVSRDTAFGARKALEAQLPKSGALEILKSTATFNEICLVSKKGSAALLKKFHKECEKNNMLAGVFVEPPVNSEFDLGLTLAFTERHKKHHVENLSKILESVK